MRAWQLHPGFNSLEGLQQTTLPTPEPGPHEVLVRVRACSLNYRDQLIVVGKYSAAGPLLAPQVPLSDGAGEIAAVGSAVTRWRVGDRVASCFFPAWRDGRPDPSLSAVSLGAGGASGAGSARGASAAVIATSAAPPRAPATKSTSMTLPMDEQLAPGPGRTHRTPRGSASTVVGGRRGSVTVRSSRGTRCRSRRGRTRRPPLRPR